MGLLLISLYLLRAETDRAAQAAGQRAQSEQKLHQAQSVQNGLRQMAAVAGEPPLMSLDRELAEALLMLERNRAMNMIEFINLNTVKAQSSRDALPLDGMSTQLGETDGSVRSVELRLKANYHDYMGLKRFLGGINTRPVSVRRLKVNTTSFEMDLLVLGI